MSGTLGNIYNNISFALSLHAEAMARLQEQASTGARINRASDGPSAAYRILGLNSQERSLENYIDNLSEVVSTLELSFSIVQNMFDEVAGKEGMRARLTQLTGGIYDEASRKRNAEVVNDLLDQVIMLANTKRMGQYLFGGGNTSSAPYVATPTNGTITKVTYKGSVEGRDVEVAPGVESSAFYVGDDLFRSNDRSTPEFILGNTGVTAGTGTSSVTGFTWLTVAAEVNEKQTITITGTPTSGNINIAFGATVPLSVNVGYHATAADVENALETLGDIGSGDVTCTGDFLDDANGITIEFTGALELTNVAEMVVTDVDLNNGAVPAISTDNDGGKQLSIDGGTAVGIPIGDKTNVAIINPDGQVLYVNASGTISTGVELVVVTGTHDIFNAFITIRDILKNEKGHTDAQLQTLLSNSFNSLDEIRNLLVQSEVRIGSKVGFLDNLKENLEDIRYNAMEETTRLEQADIAQVAIDLSRREVLYQMSLSVAARLMSMSLLDFL